MNASPASLGPHKLLLLELDREFIENIARQAGFEFRFEEESRRVLLDLNAETRQAPAAAVRRRRSPAPTSVGFRAASSMWMALAAPVLQTPIQLASQRDRSGRALPYSVRLQINKELPASFRLPNKAPVTEQTVYSVLFNFLNALLNTGVPECAAAR